MSQKLIILRGLPGSGKSTLARTYEGFKHFEADQFFVRPNGDYVFVPSQIGKAHEKCQENCRTALAEGHSVVVSNTFSKLWEFKPYLDMAEAMKIPVEVIEVKGSFKNIHGVPEEAISRMIARWEPYTPSKAYYPV